MRDAEGGFWVCDSGDGAFCWERFGGEGLWREGVMGDRGEESRLMERHWEESEAI